MNSIVKVLMSRDEMPQQEAEELVEEAREEILERISQGDFISADDICEEYFGLEADYIMDLLPI